jgi:hypothetical protein
LPPELAERQLREFRGTANVFSVPFVVDGQLFAGVNAIPGIRNHLLPDFRGTLIFAAALGHQRQFPLRPGADIGGQPDRQSLRARGVCVARISAALQESRKPEQIETFAFFCGAG